MNLRRNQNGISLSLCSRAERGVVCAVNFHPHTRSEATVRLETNDNQDVIKGGLGAALGFSSRASERADKTSVYSSPGVQRDSCDNRTGVTARMIQRMLDAPCF